MANDNTNYRSYGDESSSIVVDPGPWLPRLTIGYLVLLVVLLHPFTMLIRKMRKDRKLKSAMARRKALNMRHDDNDVTAKHELAESPSGSSSGHTSTLSAASSGTPSPSSHDGNGPEMAIEMGTFGDDDGYDNKNKKDRFLVDLDDDNASVYVPVTLPGDAARRENEGVGALQSDEANTSFESEEAEQSSVRQHKRRPSLGKAVSNIPRLVKSRSKELIGNRSIKASRLNRPIRHRGPPKPEGPRILLMDSPGSGEGERGGGGSSDGYMGGPMGLTSDNKCTATSACTDGSTPRLVGYRAFVGPGGGHRKNFIAAQLALRSAEDDKPFVIRKEEEQGSNEQLLHRLLLGCGVVEIDNESLHGDQVSATLYSSYSEDDITDNITAGDDETIDHGAYDEYEWRDLPTNIRNAAIVLGYCETSWDGSQDVATTNKKWNELGSDEMAAAMKLGYNEEFWNRPSPSDQQVEALDTSQLNSAIRGWDTLWAVLCFDKESRKIAKIAVPTTVEMMIGTTLSACQLAFISKYLGSDALAVYGIVDLVMSLTEIIGAGIGAAEEVMVAQSIGSGDYYRAGSVVQLSVCLYMLLAIPIYSIWIVFIDDFALYLGLGDDIAHLAASYIPIMSLYHFIGDGFSDTLGGLMRIDGKAWQMSVIDTSFSVFHTLGIVVGIVRFNFSLVDVAWLEVASSLVYGVFMYSFCACMGWLKPFRKGLFDMKGIKNGTLVKELIRTAIPLGVSEFLASGEWHILTLYAAYIGDVAAWTVAGAIWEFFEQSPEGIGTAAIIRIGYHLGQANPRKAKIAAYKSLLVCLVWSATLTMIFMCQSNAIIALFTNDDYIASILEGAVVLIGAGNCAMCIGNLAWTILSAQSRPKIAAWVYGGVGVAGICIPLASTFTFGFNFDITGLVAAIVISYATVSAVLLIFIFTSNWTKICCRIISAYSGFTFVAVEEAKGHRRWQPSIDAAAVTKKKSNSLGQDAEQTFGLKKELGLV